MICFPLPELFTFICFLWTIPFLQTWIFCEESDNNSIKPLKVLSSCSFMCNFGSGNFPQRSSDRSFSNPGSRTSAPLSRACPHPHLILPGFRGARPKAYSWGCFAAPDNWNPVKAISTTPTSHISKKYVLTNRKSLVIWNRGAQIARISPKSLSRAAQIALSNRAICDLNLCSNRR